MLLLFRDKNYHAATIFKKELTCTFRKNVLYLRVWGVESPSRLLGIQKSQSEF